MKRTVVITTIFSFFFSLAILLSAKMPTDFKTIYWLGFQSTDILILVGLWSISTICLMCINLLLDYLKIPHQEGNTSALMIYGVIMLAWVPCYLSFYPGNISPDSYASIYQAIDRINSTAHPVLFTLLVKICVQAGLPLFGSVSAGIALFSIVQMLALDGILTYTVKWMERHHAPKWIILLSIVYFALNPLIVRYSFTMWKDILFSGVMLLLMLSLYDISTDAVSLNDHGTLFRFVLLALLAAFLRNRIIYAVAGIFILLLIMYRMYWKKLLPVFLGTVILTFVIQGPVYSFFNIKPSNFAEGQGVSLQQIAAVVVENGNLSEDEAEFINQVIPLEDIPKAYFESTVDNLKCSPLFDHDFLNAHSKEYLNVWKSVLLKNPWTCTKAWLMTTRGFWGFNVWIEPFAITWPNEELGISQRNFIRQWTGMDLSYFSNGVLIHIGKVPVVRHFFELGSLGWFGAFCFVRLLIKRRYETLIALLPLCLLWIVLIFSTPIFFEARYMFVYHLSLPVLGCMLLMGDKMDVKKEQ